MDMTKKVLLGSLVIGAMALAGVQRAECEVTGSANMAFARSGKTASSAMFLASMGRVDGINGELTYDTALMENPRVVALPGAAGFTALSHELSPPGTMRFVLFKNPADRELDLSQAVIYFQFDTLPGLIDSASTTVNFTMAAAAEIVPGTPSDEVVSVTPVTFGSFEIFINGNAAQNWSLYD